MTSQAIEGLGALQAIDLPDEGEEFEQGDVLTTLEGSDGSLEVLAPVTGVVHEINEAVQEEPEIAADDPLEEGWLIKIEIEDASGLQSL
jgi:glycine cleavage system H protein